MPVRDLLLSAQHSEHTVVVLPFLLTGDLLGESTMLGNLLVLNPVFRRGSRDGKRRARPRTPFFPGPRNSGSAPSRQLQKSDAAAGLRQYLFGETSTQTIRSERAWRSLFVSRVCAVLLVGARDR